MRVRFGRVHGAEGGCLSVEKEIAEVVEADLTLQTDGASAAVRNIQRAAIDATQRGLSREDAGKSLDKIPLSKNLGKLGGGGYFYILNFVGVLRDGALPPGVVVAF